MYLQIKTLRKLRSDGNVLKLVRLYVLKICAKWEIMEVFPLRTAIKQGFLLSFHHSALLLKAIPVL
jgi:hypothetical protein